MEPIIHRQVVLGVTGGVAAYKAADLVRLLVKAGIGVQVVMTEAARGFVTPATFQALSGHPVWTDLWDDRSSRTMPHIDLSRSADAVLVVPASADFMAKVAHGLANDLLSTLVTARRCPLFMAPAMNREMWNNPAHQRNLLLLQADGVILLGPDTGEQACGEFGEGRMAEPAEILEAMLVFYHSPVLQGKKVVVTAGPTFEAIDPVRGITNASSGKMGYALAQAAREAGAEVVLVTGPTALVPPAGCAVVPVRSASEMLDAVMAHAPGADLFFSVAAVADYTPRHPSMQKIKKASEPLTLELVPTVDILKTVAALPDAPFCVGFAAESQNLETFAQAKRKSKGIPLVVGNLASRALSRDDNEVILVDAQGVHPLPAASKRVLARQILKYTLSLAYPEQLSHDIA